MTDAGNLVMARLDVHRTQLLQGLRRLVRPTKTEKAGEAVLVFDDRSYWM